ncbi:MAG TPA: hypothetical protein VIF15_13095, partial [Polyangiaceae bacterium]
MSTKRLTRSQFRVRNTKVQSGIDKDLGSLTTIQLGGEDFTVPALKAVFARHTAAINASDRARKVAEQCVLEEKAAQVRSQQVLATLSSYLLGTHGPKAVQVLGHFGIEAPKTEQKKSVATRAVAVAKGKATRAARATKGPVARKAVKGKVDERAIKDAIDRPDATRPS